MVESGTVILGGDGGEDEGGGEGEGEGEGGGEGAGEGECDDVGEGEGAELCCAVEFTVEDDDVDKLVGPAGESAGECLLLRLKGLGG